MKENTHVHFDFNADDPARTQITGARCSRSKEGLHGTGRIMLRIGNRNSHHLLAGGNRASTPLISSVAVSIRFTEGHYLLLGTDALQAQLACGTEASRPLDKSISSTVRRSFARHCHLRFMFV
jgi:hypothetical protein